VQFLAAFIMKGRLQAMIVASTFALLSLPFPPVSIVSSASVALVTLRRGSKEGLYVLICACLAAGLLSTLLLGGYQFALLYGLVLWVPVWLIALVLREGRHLGVAIEIAILLGIAAVIGFYLYQTDVAQFWRQILEVMIQPMLAANPDVPIESLQQSADVFAHYMTGGIAAGTVYGLLFGLFLARWWQSVLYNPGGFRLEYLALRSHPKLAIASVLIIAVAFLASGMIAELCWNITILLFVLYTFMGAAVLHCTFASMKTARFMVPFLYATVLIIPHVMVLVALFGLLDTWLDLRNKLKPNGA
jgi:hypothetical protein